MKSTNFKPTLLAIALGGAMLALTSGQASASAFALAEQSVSGLGNAFSGASSSAEDASTVYWNAAGMSFLAKPQVVVALHAITPSAKFNDQGSQGSALPTPVGPLPLQAVGGNGGDAGGTAAVPNLYATLPINAMMTAGLGVNAPFGLATEYDSSWVGRFQAIKSEIKTLNINPSLSFKLGDRAAVGFGVSYQKFDAELTSAVNFTAAIAGSATLAALNGGRPVVVPGLEGKSRVVGDDAAYGYNVGGMFQIDDATRVGVAYRSSIKYHVQGDVSFERPTTANPLAAAGIASLGNGAVKLDIEMPDLFSAGITRRMGPNWDLMADLQWTGWSKIKNLDIYRSTGELLSHTPENFKDTWRFGVGTNFRMNDKLTLRGGIALDQSPINDTDRTPRLPDSDRTWLSLGAQYKVSPATALDFGFTYIMVKNPSINQNAGNTIAYGLLKGDYSNNVTILSVQLTQSF